MYIGFYTYASLGEFVSIGDPQNLQKTGILGPKIMSLTVAVFLLNGRNPTGPTEVGSLSHYLRGVLVPSQGVFSPEF